MRSLHRLCAHVIAAALSFGALGALGSGDARAEAPAGSSAMAEALFQEARELFKNERFAEACAKFAESQRIEPKLGTLLRLAVCHEKVDRTASAWAEYISAAEIAHREGQKDREDLARRRVEILSKKLVRVVIKTSAPPAGLSISLDDKLLDAAALNTPLPVDPGKHRLAAAAPSKKGWSTSVDVPPGPAEIALEIPALDDLAQEPAPEPPPPVVVPPPLAAAPPPGPPLVLAPAPEVPPARAYPWTVPAAFAGFGVGAVGLIAGSISGGLAFSEARSVTQKCNGVSCPTSEASALAGANALATASNVTFAVGGVGVAAGLVFFVMSRQRQAPALTGVSVTPIVGPGTVGVAGRF